MKHKHFSSHIRAGLKLFKKDYSLFNIAVVVGIVLAVFFVSRGTVPHSSELSYIERSSVIGNIGSVVPASCESVPPTDHFRGDCSPIACTVSPSNPRAGDTVTWSLSQYDINTYTRAGNYVTSSYIGTSPSYTSNTNYGGWRQHQTSISQTYSSPGTRYATFFLTTTYWATSDVVSESCSVYVAPAPAPAPAPVAAPVYNPPAITPTTNIFCSIPLLGSLLCPSVPQIQTCQNGAANPPACTVNNGGSCLNGATNPSTCSTKTCPNGSTIPVADTCPPPTQTCLNGSVILATDTCPMPVPIMSVPTPPSAAEVPYSVTWGSSPGVTSCVVQERINGGSWFSWPGQVPAGSISGSGSVTPTAPGVEDWRNVCVGPGGVSLISSVTSHTVTPALCQDGSIKATIRCVRRDVCDTTVGTETCGVCNAPALTDCLFVNIGSFTAQPSRVVSGNSYILSWTSSGANSCSISGTLNGVQIETASVGVSSSMTSARLRSNQSALATYTLTCSNARYSDTKSINIQVLSPTVIEF